MATDFLVKLDTSSSDRQYIASAQEFDPDLSPAVEDWASMAANLGSVTGNTYTQTRCRQIAYEILRLYVVQMEEINLQISEAGQ